MNVLRSSFVLFIFLTITTGIVYPLFITGLSNAFFNYQAKGSLIEKNNRTIGSALIGQSITDVKYFHGRPSATPDSPYNGLASSGSNLAVNNPELQKQFAVRAQQIKIFNNQNNVAVPVDLITASASGLDPHISPSAAYYQAARVAKVRRLALHKIRHLIADNTERPFFSFLGEPVVNVLKLNIALDVLERSENAKIQ
ncbi:MULTISPECIES: potassium-transporting ATPase subunit KdpC [unclassified Arsenophonus]|uniref:potassium-transporting ATPase subunit KdpC n=1 Tax=unclassified Arsenophonus TaxID=2627083 RepID=UPI002856BD55|nr:potassium-transporting ATPase subunit KdpC [Arsenophonus sp.]MDR5610637.1 potassium-transporting ATPase subunit KdpC [Arsenophonus sp.]MDR5614467.1 potassium-transporting ATPase subunit KdpC [Arsenophonus sp.]